MMRPSSTRRVLVLARQLCAATTVETQEWPQMKLEIVNVDGGNSRVAIITLNSPKTLNSWDDTMLNSFNEALTRVESGKDKARCLVVTGEGRGFSSGANLTGGALPVGDEKKPAPQAFAAKAGGGGAGSVLELKYKPLMLRLRDLPMPYLALVNGPCAGVGMSFAMAADMIVAADDAFFLQAFRNVGLVPDGGATYLLPRKVGWARAMEMTLLGERLPAAKALEYGLVNKVVPKEKLRQEGLEVAEKLATGPTQTLSMIRNLMWDTFNHTYEQQMAQEADFQNRAGSSNDAKIAIKAFAAKEKAVFKGE